MTDENMLYFDSYAEVQAFGFIREKDVLEN